MSGPVQEIDLEELSRTLRMARESRGWTLEHLARELWVRGFATSQNKLWRLENNPPTRIDTELLLWLEKILEVHLLGGDHQRQVLINDVISLIESFGSEGTPAEPKGHGLRRIHDHLKKLLLQKAG